MKTEMRNQEGSNLPDPKIGRKQFWIKTARHKPELAKQKSYSKKNMADCIQSAKEKLTDQKEGWQFELKKIKQQEAMLTASWKTYTNHTQSNKSVIRRYFTLILMFKEGVPDRAPSFCFKIYPEKKIIGAAH